MLLGRLGDDLVDYQPEMGVFQNYVYVNEALQNVAEKQPRVGFVPADGLRPNPDNLHFSAKALREFGLRYYGEFLKLENTGVAVTEKSADAAKAKSAMEAL